MEEWQESGRGVSEHQRMLSAMRCGVSGETKPDIHANDHQAGRGGDPRMYVDWSRTSMKGRIRQIDLRQHQDQKDKKQQRKQNEQPRRVYRPAIHGTEGTTDFRGVNPTNVPCDHEGG
jgi:hypothetical protein